MKIEMINRIKLKWGKLSQQKLESMKDDLDELVDLIQNAYGCSKDRAEREFHDFQLSLRPGLTPVVVKMRPKCKW